MPDWYRTLKAAEILHVSPWELSERPIVWQEWAIAAASAENEVQKKKREKSASKAKAGHGNIRKR